MNGCLRACKSSSPWRGWKTPGFASGALNCYAMSRRAIIKNVAKVNLADGFRAGHHLESQRSPSGSKVKNKYLSRCFFQLLAKFFLVCNLWKGLYSFWLQRFRPFLWKTSYILALNQPSLKNCAIQFNSLFQTISRSPWMPSNDLHNALWYTQRLTLVISNWSILPLGYLWFH